MASSAAVCRRGHRPGNPFCSCPNIVKLRSNFRQINSNSHQDWSKLQSNFGRILTGVRANPDPFFIPILLSANDLAAADAIFTAKEINEFRFISFFYFFLAILGDSGPELAGASFDFTQARISSASIFRRPRSSSSFRACSLLLLSLSLAFSLGVSKRWRTFSRFSSFPAHCQKAVSSLLWPCARRRAILS